MKGLRTPSCVQTIVRPGPPHSGGNNDCTEDVWSYADRAIKVRSVFVVSLGVAWRSDSMFMMNVKLTAEKRPAYSIMR